MTNNGPRGDSGDIGRSCQHHDEAQHDQHRERRSGKSCPGVVADTERIARGEPVEQHAEQDREGDQCRPDDHHIHRGRYRALAMAWLKVLRGSPKSGITIVLQAVEDRGEPVARADFQVFAVDGCAQVVNDHIKTLLHLIAHAANVSAEVVVTDARIDL